MVYFTKKKKKTLEETTRLQSHIENTNKRKWFANVFLKGLQPYFFNHLFPKLKRFCVTKTVLKTFCENVWLEKCF